MDRGELNLAQSLSARLENISVDSVAGNQRTIEGFRNLQKYANMIAILFGICTVVAVALSSYFSDILGQSGRYTNLSGQWQACFTYADMAYIPFAAMVQGFVNTTLGPTTTCLKTDLTDPNVCNLHDPETLTCVLGVYGCLSSLVGDDDSALFTTDDGAPLIPEVGLPTGHFLAGLSYVGLQGAIFGAICHAALHRALRHPSWLPSTICLMCWFLFAIFSYYTVNPVLPVPNQVNSTLLLYLIYGSSKAKFDNFNDGDNDCGVAYDYLWGYLAINLIMASTVFAAICIGFYAESLRYTSKTKPHFEPLHHTTIPVILGLVTLVFYLIMAGSKLLSTDTELQAIAAFPYATQDEAGLAGKRFWWPTTWFPFVQTTFDIATVLYMGTFMSIIRGYTIQSLTAFRLACVFALVFTITAYPPIIGAIQFYDYNDFNNYDTCWEYFYSGPNNFYFGYPSVEQSKDYCLSFRLSLAAQLGIFITMHCVTAACAYTLWNNGIHGRLSEDLETLEDTAKRFEERLSRQSSLQPQMNTDADNPLIHPKAANYNPPSQWTN